MIEQLTVVLIIVFKRTCKLFQSFLNFLFFKRLCRNVLIFIIFLLKKVDVSSYDYVICQLNSLSISLGIIIPFSQFSTILGVPEVENTHLLCTTPLTEPNLLSSLDSQGIERQVDSAF